MIHYLDTVRNSIDMALPKTKTEFDDVSNGKKSGYYFEGKEVITGRRRGRPPKYRANPTYFSQDRKIEAATLYCVYGDVDEVSKLTDIPPNYLRSWKQEPWWIEIQKQVYVEQNEGLAARISNTLDVTLEHLKDRLQDGDYFYDRKTGETRRSPVNTKTLAVLFDTLSHHRTVVRGEPTSITAKIGVDDRLKTLQEAFLKFAAAKEINSNAQDQTSNNPNLQTINSSTYEEAEIVFCT